MRAPDSTILSLVGALSHPGVSVPEPALDCVAAAVGRRTLEVLIERWSHDPEHSELVAFMRSAREAPQLGLEHCWGAGLTGPAPDGLCDSTIELCLGLSSAGCTGDWTIAAPGPRRIRVGRYQLDVEDYLSVVGTPGSLRLRTKGRRYAFVRQGGHWVAERLAPRSRMLPTFSVAEREIVVIDRSSMGTRGTVTGLPVREALDWDVEGGPWSSAATLLERHSVGGGRWCSRLIRAVIVLDSGDRSAMFSGSTSRWPGVVESSHHPEGIKLAESLVHEASHQHFFLASTLGPVDDGSDAQLYYSPVVRRDRPIDKILFAYHAFSNVLLFYRSCIGAGVDTGGFCEVEHDRLLPTLEHLDSTLRSTRALTPVGRALWIPLARELQATS